MRLPGGERAAAALKEFAGVLPGAQSSSAGIQYGAAHGRGHAPPPCRLCAGGHWAEPGAVHEGFHEAGVKAARI